MAVAKEQIQQLISENNINRVADIYTLLKDRFKDPLYGPVYVPGSLRRILHCQPGMEGIHAQFASWRKEERTERAVELTRRLALSKGKYSALATTALMVVLVSGTFTDNGFRMPPTAAVVSNFKKVSKDMKRPVATAIDDNAVDKKLDKSIQQLLNIRCTSIH